MEVAKEIKKHMEREHIDELYVSSKTNIPAKKLTLMLEDERKITFDEYELICEALNVELAYFINKSLRKGVCTVNKSNIPVTG